MDGRHCKPTGALVPQRGGDHLRARQVPGARTLRGAISRQAWLPSRSINTKIEDLGVIRWDDMGTLVVVMPEDTCPVQWTGGQAVGTLPQHIDGSNADQIREQLLWIINRGAAVLIVDLTGTVSCDYSGADALARVHDRAVADRTELRLAVNADVVAARSASAGLTAWSRVYLGLARRHRRRSSAPPGARCARNRDRRSGGPRAGSCRTRWFTTCSSWA